MAPVPQIFTRQPRSVDLFNAQPQFTSLPGFVSPSSGLETRCAQYSPNGSYFIYSQPERLHLVDPASGNEMFTIELPNVMELNVSPFGNYITTWTPVSKLDDGSWFENAKVIKVNLKEKTFDIIRSFVNKSQSGWIPQYTSDESMMALLASPFVLDFYKLDERKIQCTLNFKDTGKIESFAVSPGKNPSVAVFIAAQKGNPAFIRVYSLPNVKTAVSQKSFFKGESCTFHWNILGTSLLALVSTDVDASNRSYYGETQLYLLGISGSFDQKIDLPKEGPIHEVTWSPTSREFAVIHGFMPAAITFFDARGNSIHSLPEASRNTILYSPHAKYILVAGFGNLPGDIDILDRQDKFKKVASFQASNTSVCKWSPDGRFILTATTSPRLRVDNGLKIWYLNGNLVYQKHYDVLYNIDWRSQPLEDFPPITASKIDIPDCKPHESAIEHIEKQAAQKASTKGAYRPPRARGKSATPSGKSLADLDAERNGTAKFQPTGGPSRKVIPGWAPVTPSTDSSSESKAAQKNKKKRANKVAATGSTPNVEEVLPVSAANETENGVIGGVFSLEEKKIRNLLKKLRAIEVLKMKQANGEHLEDTQVSKITTEDKVRGELEALGWKDE